MHIIKKVLETMRASLMKIRSLFDQIEAQCCLFTELKSHSGLMILLENFYSRKGLTCSVRSTIRLRKFVMRTLRRV